MIHLAYMLSRIRNLVLVLWCVTVWLSMFFCRKNDKSDIKTIVVVQLAWLGDMVCTTPVFRAIKNKWKDCRVIVIGLSRTEEVLRFNDDVDRFVIWKEDLSYLKDQLKTEVVDFACIMTPNFFALAALYLISTHNIVAPYVNGGYSPYETRLYKLLSSLISIRVSHRFGHYAPGEYLRLLKPIGIESLDTAKHLSYSDQAMKVIDDLFTENGITSEDLLVAISPSAGNKIKNWPADRFAGLADYLIEKYNSKVFVIGSIIDREEITKMLESSRQSRRIINLYELLSIDQLKAFISRIDIFISVDTGPIYIAEAFDVATIDIIGPMDEREQPPRGPRNINVIDPSREKPIIHIMNSRIYDQESARKSIENISVNMTIEAFDYLYNKYFENRNTTR